MVETGGQAFAAADFGDGGLVAQAFEDDADLVVGRILLRVTRLMSRTTASGLNTGLTLDYITSSGSGVDRVNSSPVSSKPHFSFA